MRFHWQGCCLRRSVSAWKRRVMFRSHWVITLTIKRSFEWDLYLIIYNLRSSFSTFYDEFQVWLFSCAPTLRYFFPWGLVRRNSIRFWCRKLRHPFILLIGNRDLAAHGCTRHAIISSLIDFEFWMKKGLVKGVSAQPLIIKETLIIGIDVSHDLIPNLWAWLIVLSVLRTRWIYSRGFLSWCCRLIPARWYRWGDIRWSIYFAYRDCWLIEFYSIGLSVFFNGRLIRSLVLTY